MEPGNTIILATNLPLFKPIKISKTNAPGVVRKDAMNENNAPNGNQRIYTLRTIKRVYKGEIKAPPSSTSTSPALFKCKAFVHMRKKAWRIESREGEGEIGLFGTCIT